MKPHRGLLLADGRSDAPLGSKLEALFTHHGAVVEITVVPGSYLGSRTVAGRLRNVLREDPNFDVVFVHRDAEDRNPEPRFHEVKQGVQAEFGGPFIAVVPVRMTEAWLLLDENAIRFVAGNPNGTMDIGLPAWTEVERLANPKDRLQAAIATASGRSGRRLKEVHREFDTNRRLLLERLDLSQTPVSNLEAVQRLASDVAKTAHILSKGSS